MQRGRPVPACSVSAGPCRGFWKTFIYSLFFFFFFNQKTYAYFDVVFAVAKEFLYSVFFGFTKPIKRPCETNFALDNLPSLHNTLGAAGSPGRPEPA